MIFLKLGGSLITDKKKPETVRSEVLTRAAEEIAQFLGQNPRQRVLLGHGSGSFGHHHAAHYKTQLGAATPEEWEGFSKVWASANLLNVHVLNALVNAGLPAVRFSPCSAAVARNGKIDTMEMEPVVRSLAAGLLPVVHGDTAFDRDLGATILSTEEIFRALAVKLQPDVILLAGVDEGVLRQFDDKSSLLPLLTPALAESIQIGKSEATDVTGGMLSKVTTAFEFLELVQGVHVHIFSGLKPGSILEALDGNPSGTQISADKFPPAGTP